MVSKLWSMYPGKWELEFHGANVRAQLHWANCIKKFAKDSHLVAESSSEDGQRFKHNFEIM